MVEIHGAATKLKQIKVKIFNLQRNGEETRE